MSESGVSQYAKRLQQRFTEGMLAVRDCMVKGGVMTDDDRWVGGAMLIRFVCKNYFLKLKYLLVKNDHGNQRISVS